MLRTEDANLALHNLTKSDPERQRQFSRRLRACGLEKKIRECLLRISPDTEARIIESGGSSEDFFQQVGDIGRRLALMNAAPDCVAAALAEYGEMDESLRLSIVLKLNQGYSEIREREWRALQSLLHVGDSTRDLETLLPKLLNAMVQIAGGAAGQLYLLNTNEGMWERRASTCSAATTEVQEVIRATPAIIRHISSATASKRGILDRGWPKAWQSFWSIPLLRNDELKGVIQLAFDGFRVMLPREIDFLSMAAERCLTEIEQATLLESMAERETRRREVARRMLQVEEIERRKISRELHDDSGQQLVVIRLQLEMIEQSLPLEQVELRERLAEVRDLTEKTILDIRRLISDLSPAVLEQLGLPAAVRQLANRLSKDFEGRIKLHIGDIPALSSEFQIVVYRLAQECLQNVSKHSRADNVSISLDRVEKSLLLQVEDDGTGFDVEEATTRRRCFGLAGMRERVNLLGGVFQITSTLKSGQTRIHSKELGTKVVLRLPIPENSL